MPKILIIEDNSTLRNLLLDVLQENNFAVIEANDGLEGITKASLHRPDLIICDVMMPNLDGYGVLEELQKHSETATIPFIFLTAKETQDSLRYGMELGADDYLTKPFAIEDLLKAINTRLAKKQHFHKLSQQKLDELRQSLISSLPHELLTPLHGILGFTEVLKLSANSLGSSEVMDIANEIELSAQRLQHLVQNFLLLARLELAQQNTALREEFLTGTTMSLWEIMSSSAKERSQFYERPDEIKIELEDVLLTLGDQWLQKIATELIDNALKFSDAGTLVEVRGEVQGDRFVLSVCDRGFGMTAEQVANIGAYMQFERKLYEQQGSGLGLSLVQRLTELAGGNFSLESTPKQGTEVTLSLPLGDSDNFLL
ncbi:response regulator [Spirulina sp. CS-785/01]|uniref:hybrid sensor histidine kinase/response regulator n=1 Tax=Spirulina sp. CS-785/01 TaxID=3021716 RepID=UPI00232D288E|nr:response regulator [Spirulina sp. CS-785/01]MDB9315204.1 response regulator [Spirulina sp. CS-785/01]